MPIFKFACRNEGIDKKNREKATQTQGRNEKKPHKKISLGRRAHFSLASHKYLQKTSANALRNECLRCILIRRVLILAQ